MKEGVKRILLIPDLYTLILIYILKSFLKFSEQSLLNRVGLIYYEQWKFAGTKIMSYYNFENKK